MSNANDEVSHAPVPAPTEPPKPANPEPVKVVPAPVAPKLPLPAYGDPVAQIKIPKIGITRTVVEGVTVAQLARGPGHYPESPLPGQKGNVSVAGHRTTYGQPFHNIDKLEKGDQILTKTVQGDFVYVVDSLEIVQPNDVAVLADKGDNRLTLIACHPKYSLSQRIIVYAILKGEAAPAIAGQDKLRAEAGRNGGSGDNLAQGESVQRNVDGPGLSGEQSSKTPAVLWAWPRSQSGWPPGWPRRPFAAAPAPAQTGPPPVAVDSWPGCPTRSAYRSS